MIIVIWLGSIGLASPSSLGCHLFLLLLVSNTTPITTLIMIKLAQHEMNRLIVHSMLRRLRFDCETVVIVLVGGHELLVLVVILSIMAGPEM